MEAITIMSVLEASQSNRLYNLLRDRLIKAKATAEYIIDHWNELTPERQKELRLHLDQQTASINEMGAEYTRLTGIPFHVNTSFDIN